MRVGVLLARPEQSEEFLVAVADELHGIKDDSSRDIAFNYSTGEMTFCFTVDGNVKPQQAMDRALVMARSAFHAARGATPDWEQARWSIVPEPTRDKNTAALASPVG